MNCPLLDFDIRGHGDNTLQNKVYEDALIPNVPRYTVDGIHTVVQFGANGKHLFPRYVTEDKAKFIVTLPQSIGDYKSPNNEVKRQYQEFIPIPDYDKDETLELIVSNDNHNFIIPTGGLSSDGSPLIFNWDIYKNFEYYGSYSGTSGPDSFGISVQLGIEQYDTGSEVILSHTKDQVDRSYPFRREITTTLQSFDYTPFYIVEQDDGIHTDYFYGTYNRIKFTMNDTQPSIIVNYKPVSSSSETRNVIQFLLVYPKNVPINQANLSLYTLDLRKSIALDDLWLIPNTPKTDLTYAQVNNLCAKVVAYVNRFRPKNNDNKPAKITNVSIKEHPFDSINPYEFDKRYFTHIAIRPRHDEPVKTGWLRPFGFRPPVFTRADWNSNENKALLRNAAVVITPLMVCDQEASNDICKQWFYDCINLDLKTSDRFSFLQSEAEFKKVGDDFMYETFFRCTALTQFPAEYAVPANMQSCGRNFMYATYKYCVDLEKINQRSYTLPPFLTKIGNNFCVSTFQEAISLEFVSDMYNEPLTIEQSSLNHESYTFANCISLKKVSNIYQESKVTLPEVPNNAYSHKFDNCVGLDYISEIYRDIRTEGGQRLMLLGQLFCVEKFRNVTAPLANDGLYQPPYV